MDEQNKQTEQQPEQQPACEKKLSRTTLTFYIVGLFSVAIALILISYVAQARADRQLDTLTDQLTEQQTVAQGAAQKVEDLQKQYDALSQELYNARKALGLEENETVQPDMVSIAHSKDLIDTLLLSAEHAARIGDMEKASKQIWQLEDSVDPTTQLKPESEDGLMTDEQYEIYQQLKDLLAEQEQ